jgi:phosphotransferase system HPr-like phosphotransfer protein
MIKTIELEANKKILLEVKSMTNIMLQGVEDGQVILVVLNGWTCAKQNLTRT